ncbi:MAG: DUF1295 domain-containing protein [Candidatus Moraniibacteriota bacterium]|nr:MAG: DUF1295 domain-containing protein [Candidatus Moranbacteria bacterium]
MEFFLENYSILSFAIFLYMTLWFFIALLLKRSDIADIAWGLGFILVVWISYFLKDFSENRGFLISILVSIWGLRLAGHIYLRNRGKEEDYRYKKWRNEWGKWFYMRTYAQVFLLQGTLLLLVVSPAVIGIIFQGESLDLRDGIGICIWMYGFLFESVGDFQLSKFIKNPQNKGKIMQSGLWAYTRHPNYFGEVTQWWGIWILSLATPFGWLGIIGPLAITFLIVKISGIPLLEENMKKNPDFQKYASRVSIFFPLPPRKE